MKYIFCSAVYDTNKYQEYKVKTKSDLSLSDPNLINGFIHGIEDNIDDHITLVNCTPIPNYPDYPQIFFRREIWEHTIGAYDYNCEFVNLPVLKQMTRCIAVYNCLKSIIKAQNEDFVIITYDIHIDICKAIFEIKNEYSKRVSTILILPDIPEMMMKNGLKSGGKFYKSYVKTQMSYIQNFDMYILLTKYMKKYILSNNVHYTIVEGIYDDRQFMPWRESEHNIILYTGLLKAKYGLVDLINSVRLLNARSNDDQYELWFCGGGELKDYIVKLSTHEPFIRYLGYVDNEEIKKLQSLAKVLINPRRNEEEYTKYSFPSKTLTYLASGKPVIAYKLDGIPDEYDDYINYIVTEGDAVENLAREIVRICSLPSEVRRIMGEEAQWFIREKKNPKIQCSKIVDMIKIFKSDKSKS